MSVDLPAPLSPSRPTTSAAADCEVYARERGHGAEALLDAAHLHERSPVRPRLHACLRSPPSAGAPSSAAALRERLEDDATRMMSPTNML